jgi:hypothetical protein
MDYKELKEQRKKELLKDYNELRAAHSYADTIMYLTAKYYYSVSYMRKLVTKARREV